MSDLQAYWLRCDAPKCTAQVCYVGHSWPAGWFHGTGYPVEHTDFCPRHAPAAREAETKWVVTKDRAKFDLLEALERL